MPADPGAGGFHRERKPRPITFGDAPQRLIAPQVKKQVKAEPKPSVLLNGWAVRRQRLLRSRGFNVVVDGIWGPASQGAWAAYLRGQSTPRQVVKPARVAATHGPAPERHNLITVAAQKRARHVLEVTRARQREAAIQRRAQDLGPAALDARRHNENILTDYELALDHELTFEPQLIRAHADTIRLTKTPEQMTAHELLVTTVDPASGKFSPSNPKQVRTIQRWLRAHGNPKLALDGAYGPETNHALTTTLHRISTAERAKQVKLVEQRYTPAVVDRAARLLGIHVDPTPGHLLDLLQSRTFQADYLYGALERAVLSDPRAPGLDASWIKWRDQFVQKAAHQANPWTPAFIEASAASLAVDSPLVAAVTSARDFDDFKRKLKNAERKAEKQYLDYQKSLSVHHRGFWGTIGAGLTWLPRQTEEAVVSAYTAERDLFTGKQFESGYSAADAVSRAHITVSEFHESHPWLGLLADVVADPLNLVPGKVFLAPLVGLGRTTVALERVGYRLAADGSRIRYIPLTLTVPARAGRLVYATADETAARVAAHFAEQGALPAWERQLVASDAKLAAAVNLAHRGVVRAYSGAKHAAQLRDEAMIAARKQVRDRVRQGFRPVRTAVAKGVAQRAGRTFDDLGTGSQLSASDLLAVHLSESQVINLTDSVFDGRLGKAVAKWARLGISLQAHDGVSVPSFVGHQLTGALEERARVRIAEGIADRDAKIEAARVAGRSGGRVYEIEYERLYDENIKLFGTHFRGGIHQPYDAELFDAVRSWRKRMFDIVVPALQRRIEQLAEESGTKLWDETGAWLHPRSGAVDGAELPFEGATEGAALLDVMRSEARANFERFEQLNQEVVNPIHGKFYDRADAELMMEHEIERRVSAIELRAEVRAAAGQPIARKLIDADIEDVHRDVINAWQQKPEKWTDRMRWTDAREFVPAPYLYTGHLTERPILDPARNLFDGDERVLDQLVALGYREGAAPAADADEFVRTLDAFRRSVSLHEQNLDDAAALLLQKKLRDNGLFWSALRHREAGPLRAILHAFEGATAGWKFLTLAARPAWLVRNVADNTLKVLLQGTLDPRAWIAGSPQPGRATADFFRTGPGSVFGLGLRDMRETVAFIEKLTYGAEGRATQAFDAVLDKVFETSDDVLQALFGLHGIPVNERLIREGRFGVQQGFKNRIWDLMGNRPEAYFKRVLYRDQYRKALKRGLDDYQASKYAWSRVEKTLFDYSKVSVVESNLALFAPFIQFWRKNTTFWLSTFAEKPWFVADLAIYEQNLQDAHADWPAWMRRYIPLREAADLTASVPGLGWLVNYLTDDGNSLYDPLNYFSFAPLYRSFKSENPELLPDRAGWKFVAPFIDAMNDWGLGINPFLRKPLELAGVLNFRAWQSIFPETELVQAFTREYAHGLFGDQGLDLEAWLTDPILEALGQQPGSSFDRASFDVYVNKEIAAQIARGESPSRARAERKIKQFLWVQTLLGFVGGVYQRRMTPQDFYTYQLVDAVDRGERDYQHLSADDKKLYKLFRLRKADPVTYDRYVQAYPLIDAYYNLADFDARESWKQQHPEIIPFVEPAFSRNLPRPAFATTQRLITDTQLAFEQSDFARAVGVDYQARKDAESLYVTDELRAFWARNDTPGQLRTRMLRGIWNNHLRHLNDTFHAIPANDYEAKQAFLDQHPVLWDSWQQNNTAADDLSSIHHFSNAALRERYFEYLGAKDYDGAHAFLHQFPFIFEDTSAADRVDPRTGEWQYGSGTNRSDDHPSTPKARAYLAAKQGLDYMFKTLTNWPSRNRFIVSDDPRAAAARDFLAAYDGWVWRNGRFAPASFWSGQHQHGLTQHARDWLAVQDVARWWFNLLKADKAKAQDWLDGDSDAARRLRRYFKKWGNGGGMTEHAKAYLTAKPYLDRYFGVPKADRKKWLAEHPHDANVVLDFFKKWGHQSAKERAWKKYGSWAITQNPELAQRLEFWQRYWTLSPVDRPAYVAANATRSGVFIYGVLGDTERHDAEQRYLREAFNHGIKTKQTALYLRAKPLLDIYFTLSSSDQALFARANPEVSEYLDAYGSHTVTGDKQLDSLIERYFKLPASSQARSDFLQAHPEVQRYFDKRSTPAERAMRALVNTYFQLDPADRKQYLLQHPEISAYFDSRRQQHDNEIAAALAFDQADPRLAEYWRAVHGDIEQPGLALRDSMRRHSHDKPDTLDARRTRRPLQQ